MKNVASRCRFAAFAGLASALFLVATGCGDKGSAVEGTVKYQGKTVEGAQVQLVTEDGTMVAMGITDPSGKFRLADTKGKNTVPHGTYKVTVTKKEGSKQELNVNADGTPSKAQMEMMMGFGSQKGGGKPKELPKSLVPEKFSSPKTTTLSITVPPTGAVELDLGS